MQQYPRILCYYYYYYNTLSAVLINHRIVDFLSRRIRTDKLTGVD